VKQMIPAAGADRHLLAGRTAGYSAEPC